MTDKIRKNRKVFTPDQRLEYAKLMVEDKYTNQQVMDLSGAGSWRMDETYIKVKGQWVYLYRAVDKFGNTIDFKLSEQRKKAAATAFF
jgi:transposase-like protein